MIIQRKKQLVYSEWKPDKWNNFYALTVHPKTETERQAESYSPGKNIQHHSLVTSSNN